MSNSIEMCSNTKQQSFQGNYGSAEQIFVEIYVEYTSFFA